MFRYVLIHFDTRCFLNHSIINLIWNGLFETSYKEKHAKIVLALTSYSGIFKVCSNGIFESTWVINKSFIQKCSLNEQDVYRQAQLNNAQSSQSLIVRFKTQANGAWPWCPHSVPLKVIGRAGGHLLVNRFVRLAQSDNIEMITKLKMQPLLFLMTICLRNL